jgi:hypothetical protein
MDGLTVVRGRDVVLLDKVGQLGRRGCRSIIERQLNGLSVPHNTLTRATHSQDPIRGIVEIRRLVAPVRERTDRLGGRV